LPSKIKNIFLCKAIGDALGLATEFMSKAEIAQNYSNGIHNYDDIIRSTWTWFNWWWKKK